MVRGELFNRILGIILIAVLLYLAWQYARFHRLKLAVLVVAITLVMSLPVAIQILVDATARQLLARADSTPLVIGPTGSPLELSLGSLYFSRSNDADTATSLHFAEVGKLDTACGLPGFLPKPWLRL